ncbi:hypothetical protein ACFPIJ_57435 [Dactylosporangium cerinum]|uniref:Uncharacterized protein n=1 Tax=Dactylosporangium cerinum TaxID=1434730 RepID=A0ABV9WG75_9ACTN
MIGFVSVGDSGGERDGLEDQRRSDAIVAFLGAGLLSPPSRAVMVSALAGARRAVKEHQARHAAIDSWLAGEIRLRGVRENAAVLAVLEVPERRADVAAMYRTGHPDRVAVLELVVAVLARS